MKNLFYFLIALATFSVSSQVGIGVPTANINASAQLEVASTTKGFLPPRMTEAQKNTITSPAAGLIIYQTDGTTGLYYFDGTAWKSGLGPQGIQGLKGDTGANGSQGIQGLKGDTGATGAAGSNASVTIGAIAGSSTANGGTITSGVLNLAPADGTNGGIVTNGAQTFAGTKTFNSDLKVNGITIGKGAGSVSSNTAVGYNNLFNNTSGGWNTAFGSSVLFANTTGNNNSGIGYNALSLNTTGNNNTAIGNSSIYSNTTGVNNTAVGSSSLFANTIGTRNVAVGFNSLNANTTGSYNTSLGNSALISNVSGTNNTALGYFANVATDGLTNATAIGNGATVDASNKIQLGNASVTSVNTSATITGAGFKTPTGTSTQYLMADGTTSAGPTGFATTNGLSSNFIPKFNSNSSSLVNSSISEDGTALYIGKSTGGGGIYTGLNSDNNTRLMVNGGRELESIKMSFNGDPYNTELSFNWYSSAWRMRTERSGADITDLSFWRTVGGSTTEKMRLTAEGKLGIGTSNPQEKLEVSGNVKASGFKVTNGTSSQYLMADGSVSNGAGGNFVDLTNNQTINGQKYFSNNISVHNMSIGVGNSNDETNTVFGNNALASIQSGSANIAIGRDAAKSNNSGSSNVVIGNGANYYNESSSDIVSIGVGSLHAEKGAGNVAIGSWAGHRGNINDDLTNSVFLGKNASAGGGSIDNSVALGNGATVEASNTIQLGNGGITSVKTAGTVTASGFKVPNGNSSQYLMADGSVSSVSSATHAVGDSYGGGIVFYTWDNGAHGLIVAKNEIGANGPENFTSTTGLKWAPNGSVGSFRDGIGAGKGNTDIIISKTSNSSMQYFHYAQSTTNGYAALFAAQYLPTISSGEQQYGDWYLPSWYELNLLVNNSSLISGSGYNSSHIYWSSTETNSDYAYRAGTPGSGWNTKATLNYVLPIRQF